MNLISAMILAYGISAIISFIYLNVSFNRYNIGTLYQDDDVITGRKSLCHKYMQKQLELFLKSIVWPIFTPFEILTNCICTKDVRATIYAIITIVLIMVVFITLYFIKN